MRIQTHENRHKPTENGRINPLTKRECEVATLLAEGLSVKEVAKSLHVSAKTVDTHKTRLMSKLGVHNRVELVRVALQNGLTSLHLH
ncbi:MAG: response regulator transcription factor [Planctomycetota bacterium]